MLGADNVVEKNRVTAFIVEMMYKYDVSLKEVATAGGFQLEGPTTIDTPSRDISVPLSPDIAATPSRDWRDSRGNDAGLAVRQQYLNPPTDPWDDVVL